MSAEGSSERKAGLGAVAEEMAPWRCSRGSSTRWRLASELLAAAAAAAAADVAAAAAAAADEVEDDDGEAVLES